MRKSCRHGKNLNSDAWKALQLWKHTANQEHPFRCAGDVCGGGLCLASVLRFLQGHPVTTRSHFSTGNLETLIHVPEASGLSVHERCVG